MYKSVGRDRLYEDVVDQITTSVLDGRLKPGDPLPTETQLASEFKVSRTVVREAVRSLVAHGLVEVTPGRGTFVTTPSLDTAIKNMRLMLRLEIVTLDDLQETRQILEVPIARLAATNATEENIKSLSRYFQGMCASQQFPEEFVKQDAEFHHELAKAARNPILLILIQPIIISMGAYRDAVSRVPDMVARACARHQEILQKVVDRDGEGAAQAMLQHMNQIREDIDRSRATGIVDKPTISRSSDDAH